MTDKLIVLHMDDKPAWLENVANQVKTLTVRGKRREVIVLSRLSIPEAQGLLDGKDKKMQSLVAGGHKLAAVILDLMMGGGMMQEVERWLIGLPRVIASSSGTDLPAAARQEFSAMCPAAQVGRKAREIGIPVVILTNASRFLPEKELPLDAERRLIMAACGASQYVVKADDHWSEHLKTALEKAVS